MCCTQCSAAVLQSYETQQNTMQCVECVEHSFECSAPVLQRYETQQNTMRCMAMECVEQSFECSAAASSLPAIVLNPACARAANYTQLWECNVHIVFLVGEQ